MLVDCPSVRMTRPTILADQHFGFCWRLLVCWLHSHTLAFRQTINFLLWLSDLGFFVRFSVTSLFSRCGQQIHCCIYGFIHFGDKYMKLVKTKNERFYFRFWCTLLWNDWELCVRLTVRLCVHFDDISSLFSGTILVMIDVLLKSCLFWITTQHWFQYSQLDASANNFRIVILI